MVSRKRISPRSIWFQIHLWLGLTLGMIGIVVGLSGSILVFDHEIDEWLHPARYQVSGSRVAIPFAEYAERAAQALEGRAKPTGIRLPDGEDGPIIVFARPASPGSGFLRVYLDASSGRVLDATEGVDFIGWMHGFHENLMLREYSGREIVGFVGVAMLISSLSGIYLWWPPRRQWLKALGFRKGFGASRNLHYTFGFYGSLALALVSFTGMFLSFTDAGRAVVAAFGPLSPSPRSIQSPEGSGRPVSPDDAVDAALAYYPDAAVVGVQLPAGPRGVYRIMLREAGDESARPATAVYVDPRLNAVLYRADRATRTAGDRFLTLQRVLHEGSWWGAIGRTVTFITGLLPAVLAITGLILYLRSRRRRRSRLGAAPAALGSK